MTTEKRPWLTQREAAEACDSSRTTIRRYREKGAFPNARQEGSTWLIPVGDLLAAGLRLNKPAGPDPQPAEEPSSGDTSVSAGEKMRTELLEARHAQALAEAKVEHLQRLVEERGHRIKDLQQAMLALTPAPERAALTAAPPPAERHLPVPSQPSPPTAEDPAPPAAEPRKRWRWLKK